MAGMGMDEIRKARRNFLARNRKAQLQGRIQDERLRMISQGKDIVEESEDIEPAPVDPVAKARGAMVRRMTKRDET